MLAKKYQVNFNAGKHLRSQSTIEKWSLIRPNSSVGDEDTKYGSSLKKRTMKLETVSEAHVLEII